VVSSNPTPVSGNPNPTNPTNPTAKYSCHSINLNCYLAVLTDARDFY